MLTKGTLFHITQKARGSVAVHWVEDDLVLECLRPSDSLLSVHYGAKEASGMLDEVRAGCYSK